MLILISVTTLAALGLLFGLGLFVAHVKLGVHLDPRIEAVLNKLPGANCGACGMAGCSGLAEALVKGEAEVSRCAPAGPEIQREIAGLLGLELSGAEQKKAVLLCCGGGRVKEVFDYRGIGDCRALAACFGGAKACFYGCLGLGTCAAVCPFGAIRMGSDGLPAVDLSGCTGCGKCVAECPKDLFILVPESKTAVSIKCRSLEPGKKVIRACPTGCIACRKCEKVCPPGAIKVENNIAVIDYEKCDNCGLCVGECPRGTIIDTRKEAGKGEAAAAGKGVTAGGKNRLDTS